MKYRSTTARFLVSLVLIGLFTFPARLSRADSLDELRDSVRTAPPASSPSSPGPSTEDNPEDLDDWDDDDGGFGEVVFYLAGAALTAPFWGPFYAVGDRFNRPGYFLRHPYAGDIGYMLVDSPAGSSAEAYPWATRASSEYGTTFSGTEWVGGRVLFESCVRFGFDTDFRYLKEEISPVATDSLWLGDANLNFRFAQSERLQMRTGVGFNYLVDDRDSDFGFNFTYGGDWYPRKPWVFSSEIDLGWLGHAGLFHFRTTAGLQLGTAETYLGYDYYDIGRAPFSGLTTGLRLWF